MAKLFKAVLCLVNVIYALCGLAVACAGAWYFVQLYQLMNLRNVNHYTLDYNIFWVQVFPWLYMVVGLAVLVVAWCGFCAADGKRRSTLLMYINLIVFTVLCHIGLTTLVFVYGDGENTDHFIADTILDAFQNAATNEEISRDFNAIERKYHCCGAAEPRDYRKRRADFPLSCCDEDIFYNGKTTCEFIDSSANDRYGCSTVVTFYAKRVLIYLAIGSVIVAVMELVGLIVALSVYLKPKDKKMTIQDCESKKVLL